MNKQSERAMKVKKEKKTSKENIMREIRKEINKDAENETNTDNDTGQGRKSPVKQPHKTVSCSTDRQVNRTNYGGDHSIPVVAWMRIHPILRGGKISCTQPTLMQL